MAEWLLSDLAPLVYLCSSFEAKTGDGECGCVSVSVSVSVSEY